VIGVGLGVVLGLYASSSQSREKSDCSTSGCPSYPQGNEDYTTAKKDATGSTIAFIAGAAFLAGGVALWFTAPKEGGPPPTTARSVRLAPMILGGGGGLVLGGSL
jgi:hypothetical protein